MQSDDRTGATLTRTQHVAEELRMEILRNVLPAGTRITEEGLAERYGYSRTPVREALRLLARESLLIHVPRAYYEVASVNLDEMDVQGALNHGATPAEVEEVILTTMIYAGHARATEAIEIAREVMGKGANS
jgi:DNA-binding FadR family transcriptional regulator